MKRTLEDIRENLDVRYCDNETVLELCAEVERLNSVVAKLTRDCNSLEDDVRYNGELLARANEMKDELDRLRTIVDRINPEADGNAIDARDAAWNLFAGRVSKDRAREIWPWLAEYEAAEKARSE